VRSRRTQTAVPTLLRGKNEWPPLYKSRPMPVARYWLMKSEPTAFSFNALVRSPSSTNHWDGVRNYQARNYMREMRVGDKVLFYHSNCDPPAIVGIAVVAREVYPDHTQFDPNDANYDPRATRQKPIWEMVDLRAINACRSPVSLRVLRGTCGLTKMVLLRKGSRLSVQPVSPEEWKIISKISSKRPDARTPAATVQGYGRTGSPRRDF
jgi:predicted RNA-binding protein with PUA-like domain